MAELVELHANQFSKMGMPSTLWHKAIENVVHEVYLSAGCFTVGFIRDEDVKILNYQIYASQVSNKNSFQTKRILECQISILVQNIDAFDNVFLIDNWFTFPLRRLNSFLEDDINLLEKLEQLLGLLPLSNNQNDCANGNCSEIDEKLPSERIDEVSIIVRCVKIK